MNAVTKLTLADFSAPLARPERGSPALMLLDKDTVAIKTGVTFAGFHYVADTPVPAVGTGKIGSDFFVAANAEGKVALLQGNDALEPGFACLGGFHYAPGGNASARIGGTDQPAINPFSIWDAAFRPACPDPRGMALVDVGGRKVWVDIYLLNAEHLTRGTSAFGAPIADGSKRPEQPGGGRYPKLDYETAGAVMAHHGKSLPSLEEFFAAAYGVTEKTAAAEEPELTGLDAARTSKFGLMQATGNMWVWGHDGDPDSLRASLFGGSWLAGGCAGSRCAFVDSWPGVSNDDVGARGRSDHLQLG